MDNPNDWQTAEEISLEQMDAEMLTLRAYKEEYQRVKKFSDEAYAKYKEQERKIMDMLERSGKKTYIAEGVGRATIKSTMSVKVPSSPEEKRQFFEWVQRTLGEEARDAYMTINSRTLNKLYNELNEQYANEGKILTVDGLREPIESKMLSFTKA